MIHNGHLLPLLRPEVRLLLHCLKAGTTVQPGEFADIDIEQFLHVIDCHRLTNVVCMQIQNAPGVPTVIRERIKAQSVHNRFQQLGSVAELCRVLKQFQAHHIEVIALKGPLLSQSYYGDYTLREYKDLDILVCLADLQAAFDILIDIGYTLSETLWNSPKQEIIYRKTFHHYNFCHPERAIQIELHWRLNASEYNHEAIWSNTVPHIIGGLPVKCLAPIDTFIYLCVHGGTHQWKRLFWLLDIARIIQKEGHDFLLHAYRQAADHKVDRYVLSGCQLAYELMGVQLPPPLHEAIRQDKTIEKLFESSAFWINTVSETHQNLFVSAKTFRLSLARFVNAYRSVFYLQGYRSICIVFRDYFVNPAYWNIYAFNDRFFALNYVAAPFVWIYSVFRKGRQ